MSQATQRRYILPEEDLPTHFYNIAADLPERSSLRNPRVLRQHGPAFRAAKVVHDRGECDQTGVLGVGAVEHRPGIDGYGIDDRPQDRSGHPRRATP